MTAQLLTASGVPEKFHAAILATGIDWSKWAALFRQWVIKYGLPVAEQILADVLGHLHGFPGTTPAPAA